MYDPNFTGSKHAIRSNPEITGSDPNLEPEHSSPSKRITETMK